MAGGTWFVFRFFIAIFIDSLEFIPIRWFTIHPHMPSQILQYTQFYEIKGSWFEGSHIITDNALN